MKKTKICFISLKAYQLFNPSIKSIFGGAEVQMSFLAKELAKNDNFKVEFIVGDYKQKKKEIINNVVLHKFINVKARDGYIKKFFQMFHYYFFLNKINADIYISTTANSAVGLVSFFCKINRKKHIHRTAHEREVVRSSKNTLLDKIFLYGLKNADLLITQNKSHQVLLKKNFQRDSRVMKNSFTLKNRQTKEKSFIFWLSRFVVWKRPELFLELTKVFPQENFVMVSNIGNEKRKEWEQFKRETKRFQNLKFIEKIPFSDSQKYFDQAKMFVCTSDAEGFPNTFIQAGIGRTPILSLNVNPDSFITEYDCGYYADGDFEKMKRQLKILLKNANYWKEKSKNIYKYTTDEHDIKKNIKVFKKIIEEAVK